MLSKDDFIERLRVVSDTSSDTEQVLNLIEELSNDFSERERIIDEYSQKTFYDDSDVFDEDGVRWSERYDDLRKKYRERFFTSQEQIKEDQKEDLETDIKADEIRIDDLFEIREGDYRD